MNPVYPSEIRRALRWKIPFSMAYLLVYPILIFALAGDWLWIEGWVFSVWFVGMSAFVTWYLYRYDPALLAERFQMPGSGTNQKPWDRYFLYGVGILFLAWIVVMPLDAKRFAWSHFSPSSEVIGSILLMPSFLLLWRSFADNTYLSPLVRIQHERGQRVVSTGVYGIVRHPMYAGAILMFIGASMLLGSWCGVLFALVLSFAIAFRIL